MASNWIIHCAIVTCLLSATVLLGGCSPPIPKTWLPPAGGMMGGIPVPMDRWHDFPANDPC